MVDSQFIDTTRRQIERHFSRTVLRTFESFWSDCRLLSKWVSTDPLLGAAIRLLLPRAEQYKLQMSDVAERFASGKYSLTDKDHIVTQTFEEQAALVWAALELVKHADGQPHTGKFQAVCRMFSGQGSRNAGEIVGIYRDFALSTLRDYLNDYLDRRDMTLFLIEKYKKKCEWFWRYRLREISQTKFEGKQEGERSLAIHLYDYLHDQGLSFDIEPHSPDGLVDALAKYWAIDAKYVPQRMSPKEITKRLASGFRQVADYCNNHNRPAGYLVVYKEKDNFIQIELDNIDGSRCLLLAGKIIYYCEIDITEYDFSASHRGTAHVHTISREDLIKIIPAEASSTASVS